MTEYRIGDRITVTFTGTIKSFDGYCGCANIREDNGHNHYVFLGSPDVEGTRVNPDNWPPQAGDIWEAEGNEYYVRQSRRQFAEPFIGSCNPDDPPFLHSEFDRFKELNPRLIRRREG